MPPSASFGAASLEYPVKAAFIYQFIKFIKWPPGTLASSDNPIVIGVLGQSPILKALKSQAEENHVGHRIIIKHVKDVSAISGLHILFISPSEKADFKPILNSVKGSGVLTVSETPDFGSMGGMVNFFIDQERVRFEINNEEIEEAELKISSKILRWAKIVRSQNIGRKD